MSGTPTAATQGVSAVATTRWTRPSGCTSTSYVAPGVAPVTSSRAWPSSWSQVALSVPPKAPGAPSPGDGAAAGTTGSDGALAVLPKRPCAVTVNVYAVPLMRPPTVAVSGSRRDTSV